LSKNNKINLSPIYRSFDKEKDSKSKSKSNDKLLFRSKSPCQNLIDISHNQSKNSNLIDILNVKSSNNNINHNNNLAITDQPSKNNDFQEQQSLTVQEIYHQKKINRLNNEKIKELQSQLTSTNLIFEELKTK